ncbi:MAG: glycoside hydrolase family 10 protein [Pirellulales bacterium]
MHSSRHVLATITLFVLTAQAVAQPTDDFNEFRGLWVTRWDYSSGNASTIETIMDNAASLGITDVLFQVRGRSDAYYDSQVEPRAEALSGDWDPLDVAIDAAHERGMKLHAWINTMPLWRGTTLPSTTSDPAHTFYRTDPSFRVTDSDGVPQPLNTSYVISNPVLPEWQSHVNQVADDIVRNYDVDGLHLDYIRWLGSTAYGNLPHDDYSHQLFADATGLDADNPTNAGAYRQYIRDRITDLVRTVGQTVREADPNVTLSAAVWRDPDVGSSQVLQEYETWLEDDLLDIVMPMIYLSPSNNDLLVPNLTNVLSIPTDARVAPGIGVYLHTNDNGGPEFTVEQLDTVYQMGAGGVTLFAYSSFFASGQLGIDRQNAVKGYLDSIEPLNLGDMDINGVIDFDDIGAFVLGVTSSSSYESLYGIHPSVYGDTDRDGDIDFDDVDEFVTILVGETQTGDATAQRIAEPATSFLLVIGATFATLFRRPRAGPTGRPELDAPTKRHGPSRAATLP